MAIRDLRHNIAIRPQPLFKSDVSVKLMKLVGPEPVFTQYDDIGTFICHMLHIWYPTHDASAVPRLDTCRSKW